MIQVTPHLALDEAALEESFIRASGPGGQNVNKLSSAVQLRLNLAACTAWPEAVRARLARLAGRRLTREGVIVIIAQQFRTQDRNREDARERLFALIREAAVAPIRRRPTRPTHASRERRLKAKAHRAGIKGFRGEQPGQE